MYQEKKSFHSLISAKSILPLDSVAFAAVPEELIEKSKMTKDVFIKEIMHNAPLISVILDTVFGRIGVMLIPIIYEELYHDNNLAGALQNAIVLAKTCGAKCASLTGLIPSATNYGLDIKIDYENSNFLLTTGHGTTVSAIVLNIEYALASTKRNIELEAIACVGLGSIGLTTLYLMLSVLKHPKKLILCDIFSKRKELENIKHKILNDFNYKGEVLIAQSLTGELPELIYSNATLLIGATNIPNIVSTTSLKPGTIIVDDSAPHIFDYSSCLKRFKEQKDILVLQGGKLTLPASINFFYSDIAELASPKKKLEKISRDKSNEIMGCTLGSILPLISDTILPTLGVVHTNTAVSYYNFLKERKIIASSLQCKDYYYKKNDIEKFSTLELPNSNGLCSGASNSS